MISELYLGSNNPAKKKAVEHVFPNEVMIITQDVPSFVSPQPFSDEETRKGAINRATYLVEKLGASFAIGLEGGVVEDGEEMLLCNWGALATNTGELYIAGGARIYLPQDLADMIRNGLELGEAIDKWANKKKVREGEGTIGILTDGEITRDTMFEHVVRLLYGQWKFFKGE
ncbi:DUF84 family protein [Evansella tamaricis]|uniref:DUF84 family protein n=1 Tax=Evansella tamaricis TaxID=2069301 RepID=A0ABS6JJ73_9BACI|nr:DUF84 family protein [Evansella tamaricis]MBU9713731.1 DUF84 family protein [Evansella tamaricis]